VIVPPIIINKMMACNHRSLLPMVVTIPLLRLGLNCLLGTAMVRVRLNDLFILSSIY